MCSGEPWKRGSARPAVNARAREALEALALRLRHKQKLTSAAPRSRGRGHLRGRRGRRRRRSPRARSLARGMAAARRVGSAIAFVGPRRREREAERARFRRGAGGRGGAPRTGADRCARGAGRRTGVLFEGGEVLDVVLGLVEGVGDGVVDGLPVLVPLALGGLRHAQHEPGLLGLELLGDAVELGHPVPPEDELRVGPRVVGLLARPLRLGQEALRLHHPLLDRRLAAGEHIGVHGRAQIRGLLVVGLGGQLGLPELYAALERHCGVPGSERMMKWDAMKRDWGGKLTKVLD